MTALPTAPPGLGDDPDRLLTDAELGALLDRTAKTIQRWRHAGAGPVVTVIGGSVRYRAADVREWLLSQRRDPAGAAS